jgi:hypothetical protein
VAATKYLRHSRYNQQRRHSTIGYLSPAAFERRARIIGDPSAGHASRGILQPQPIDDRASWGIL